MKPETQRIAIAEACGYKAVSWYGTVFVDGRNVGCAIDNVPDYLNDLNAMAEAEKHLTPMESVEYRMRWLWHVYHRGLPVERIPLAAPIDATAAERAEAFLRAKMLWTD